MILSGGPIPIDAARRWIDDATSRLLGDTIGMSEAQWREPSLLPGWSRAHVATHLARGADDFANLAVNHQHGIDHQSDKDERFTELELGADRTGIELQLDLDTSASSMHRFWNEVTDWDRLAQVNDASYPLATLAIMRLHEVCVHHLDLDTGADVDTIDSEAAVWLLRWALSRVTSQCGYATEIRSDNGASVTVGAGRVRRQVSGSDARLWAWLSGRAGADSVEGARDLEFALLA